MSPTDIIAICSVVVAVLAFLATAYQAKIARHHNRLTVRPHLVWHIARRNTAIGARISFSVKNLGLGPAVVSDRYFAKNSIRFIPSGLQTDEVSEFLSHALGTTINYQLKTFGLPGKGAAIPSQAEVLIADIEFPNQSLAQVAAAEEVAGRLSFHVTYTSLYEEVFELCAE